MRHRPTRPPRADPNEVPNHLHAPVQSVSRPYCVTSNPKDPSLRKSPNTTVSRPTSPAPHRPAARSRPGTPRRGPITHESDGILNDELRGSRKQHRGPRPPRGRSPGEPLRATGQGKLPTLTAKKKHTARSGSTRSVRSSPGTTCPSRAETPLCSAYRDMSRSQFYMSRSQFFRGDDGRSWPRRYGLEESRRWCDDRGCRWPKTAGPRDAVNPGRRRQRSGWRA